VFENYILNFYSSHPKRLMLYLHFTNDFNKKKLSYLLDCDPGIKEFLKKADFDCS
jgi:hypothetical protein